MNVLGEGGVEWGPVMGMMEQLEEWMVERGWSLVWTINYNVNYV